MNPLDFLAGNGQRARAIRLLLGLALVGLPSGLIGACHRTRHQQQRQRAEQDWEKLRAGFKSRLATQQVEGGNTAEAIATLQQVVALDPGDPTVHRLLARCYLDAASFGDARTSLQKAASLGDDSAELWYLQAMLAERELRLEDALYHYGQAVERAPDNADYVLPVAECLIHLGRTGEARAFLDEHIQGQNEDPQLILLRAQTHLMLNDRAAAAADFEAVKDLLFEAPWLAEQYGLLLARLGRFAEGLAVLRPLVESGVHSPGLGAGSVSGSAVRGLATCYLGLGEPLKARKLLEEHLARSEDDGRAWWLLAAAMIRLSDWAGAERSIERGRQKAPQAPDWNILEACSAWGQGDLDKTATLLASVAVENPDYSLAQWFLAQVQQERGPCDQTKPAARTPLQ